MGNFGKCFLEVYEDGICLYSIVDIVMHVHKPMRVDANTEADVATLGLSHKCDSCGREYANGEHCATLPVGPS